MKQKTAPTPALIASLKPRLWLDYTDAGSQFAPLLITLPPARRPGEDLKTIERDMLTVADALGAAPHSTVMPFVGRDRVTLHAGGRMAVRLDGTEHVLTVDGIGPSALLVAELGQVLIIVGLDPLDPAARGLEVDRYVTHICAMHRARYAAAGVDIVR